MLCEWIKIETIYKCKYCGGTTSKEGVRKNCRALMPSVQPSRPGVAQRASNFVKDATQHVLNGRPKCSPEEIDTRFKICKTNSCGFFQSKNSGGFCVHQSCGCNVNLEPIYLNKLAWADQECPIGKWGKIDKSGV
jgi:hypothetical protein